MRRSLKYSSFALAALAIGVVAGPRTPLPAVPATPTLPENLDDYLASESNVSFLIPGTEKHIRWVDPASRHRTPIAIVYLHGFSATRQEVAPLCDRLADSLQANVFYTRLAGHGLSTDPLADVSASDWTRDAAEAVAIGRRIGERLVLVGTSTGATLALWTATHMEMSDVAAYILISPNISPADDRATIFRWPWGLQLAHLSVGETRTWEPANAEQEKFWSTQYPTRAVAEMMALTAAVNNSDLAQIDTPTLIIYSPNDTVIDPDAAVAAFQRIGTASKTLITLDEAGDRSNHVLAGDILSPEETPVVERHVLDFLRKHEIVRDGLPPLMEDPSITMRPSGRQLSPGEPQAPDATTMRIPAEFAANSGAYIP